jgi:hypothetical protein
MHDAAHLFVLWLVFDPWLAAPRDRDGVPDMWVTPAACSRAT